MMTDQTGSRAQQQATPAGPCAMVIFGAAGDLTSRKLIPALYNLAAEKLLPDDFAPLLYILSIVVAMTKCGCRITGLDDQALRHSLQWALDQSWVDEPTRGLLRAGYRAIADEEFDPDD